jgi:hypothetical protein
MRRFLFRHQREGETGFVAVLRIGDYAYGGWLGYGKPIWWKPRFLGRGNCKYGFGFGWLVLCFNVQIVELEKKI